MLALILLDFLCFLSPSVLFAHQSYNGYDQSPYAGPYGFANGSPYSNGPPHPAAPGLPPHGHQHPQPTKDARGPEGANLFVYNVPENYSEADLTALFGNFGPVLSTRIQRDLNTGVSKGFGFVSYEEPHAAQMAINSLDGFPIGNKRLTVRVKSNNQQRGGGAGGAGAGAGGGGAGAGATGGVAANNAAATGQGVGPTPHGLPAKYGEY